MSSSNQSHKNGGGKKGKAPSGSNNENGDSKVPVTVKKQELVEPDPAPATRSGDYYFDSYAHFGIHEEMLKDTVRTKTYKNAIMRNAHLFKDKVVLDVGCGTGILSLFAAQAGAKHVIGVDMSAIVVQAKEIIRMNGFEKQITILQGKIEEVDLTPYCGPNGKVDIIISEWMGYALLYESMLDSVLVARDKWLVPGGLIFPDKASMYLVGIEDADYKEEKLDFWDNVYGFDFTCIKRIAITEALVDTVDAKQVMTRPCTLFQIDINTVKKEDLDFTAPFELTAIRNDYMHAIVLYFDVTFPGHKQIGFSTSPASQYTHWKQTTFYLVEDLIINEGETVKGVFSCSRNAINHRELDVKLSYSFEGKHQTCKRELDSYFIR